MGILNVTPDSFSDGGHFFLVDSAVRHAIEMAEQGADIIDIGGESTRPGSNPISAEDEIKRVVPVISQILSKIKIPISIDTYKSETASAALDAGAVILNDISALRFDSNMVSAARKAKAVCLMHMQGAPRTMQQAPLYEDVVMEVKQFLAERASFAIQNGISKNAIWLDPGIGFGKTLEHNLSLLQNLKSLNALGYPLLVGLSRKSFISALLGGILPEERLEGTLAGVVFSALNGAKIHRVHDVLAAKRALTIIDAITSNQ